MTRMKKFIAGAIAAAGIAGGATLATTTPAEARVAIGIGIGVPGYYYGPGYYPPGPCGSYDYYYSGYCGYPTYTGGVFLGGRWVYGPHYYRWWHGRPWFWHRGGWHYWGGWRHARWNWSHHPGWRGGWHGGHGWHGWHGRPRIGNHGWHGRPTIGNVHGRVGGVHFRAHAGGRHH
jgi:hypothetical protein